MRQLQPRVAEERKKRLLQWVIHRYIKTSVPVASQSISEDAGMRLSSASIRNLLKELESEGYLHQPHTSSGRVPTDKGYRFYVDYLVDVQRLAADEKEHIERRYARRVEELDRLLAETSKLLSHASQSAGLVLSPRMEKHALKRLELIPLSGQQVLAIVVTQTGMIRHWPINLQNAPSAGQLNRLNHFLNDRIRDKPIREALADVRARLAEAEREFHDVSGLARRLLDEVLSIDPSGELYVEGTTRILSRPEELGDFDEIQSIIRVIEGKKALVRMLESEMEEQLREPPENCKGLAHVRIGRENLVPELKNLSLVTATYRYRRGVVGVLGILGSKRMEYSRMMSLVNHVSDIVSRNLETLAAEWDEHE